MQKRASCKGEGCLVKFEEELVKILKIDRVVV